MRHRFGSPAARISLGDADGSAGYATCAVGGDLRDGLAAFLPVLARCKPYALLSPASVSDRSDGRTVRLDGLTLTRAWAMVEIAPRTDGAVRDEIVSADDAYVAAALGTVGGDYMGEHWLAAFALLALTGLDQVVISLRRLTMRASIRWGQIGGARPKCRRLKGRRR
jgi:hypothetical protein